MMLDASGIKKERETHYTGEYKPQANLHHGAQHSLDC